MRKFDIGWVNEQEYINVRALAEKRAFLGTSVLSAW